MSIQETGSYLKLREAMAARTGTDARDWYLVIKARYGMALAFESAREVHGAGEVITQLFTCITAVDPITARGLTPRYADICEHSLSVDAAGVECDERTRAVVAQHTFGIVDAQNASALAEKAHAAGAFLLEDCAHCVGRMAKVDGRPVADVSVHSFGIEKALPGSCHGAAVWVNPEMADTAVRDALIAKLEALPEPDKRLARAMKNYRRQARILNHLPSAMAKLGRAVLSRAKLHEAALPDVERRGGLAIEPVLPSEWVCERVLSELETYDARQVGIAAAARTYAQAFTDFGWGAQGEFVRIPSMLLEENFDQPILKFPMLFADARFADMAAHIASMHKGYAVKWYRPLLFPGVLDARAYKLEGTEESCPVTYAASVGPVGLPCDLDIDTTRAIAEEITLGGHGR